MSSRYFRAEVFSVLLLLLVSLTGGPGLAQNSEEAPPPPAKGSPIAAKTQSRQQQNFNLPCLAPILKGIDAEAPTTLAQALLSASVRTAQPFAGVGAEAVDFSISTENAEVQRLFNQGVALVHSFWYREAQRAFRHAHSLEPENPMPLWGLALANELRPERARLYAHQAQIQSRGPISDRERMWLAEQAQYYSLDRETPLAEALPMEANDELRSRQRVRDLESIATAFPDDHEVRAFLIRELVVASHRSGVSPGSHLAVQEMADKLLAAAPGHPASGYPILLWLNEQPELAVRAAAVGVAATSGVPDGWRYAAQAYLEAGRPAEAVNLLQAALRVDHRYLAERLASPAESQNLIDNHALLVRTLSRMGRIDEALSRALELMRFPDSSAAMVADVNNLPRPNTGRLLGVILYAESLARAGLWQRLQDDLEGVPGLQPGHLPLPKAYALFWSAMAELHLDGEDDDEDNDAAAESLKSKRAELTALAGQSGRSQAVADEIGRLGAALDEALALHGSAPGEGEASIAELQNFLPAEAVARLLMIAGKSEQALELIVAAAESRPGSFVSAATLIALHHAAGEQVKAMYALDRRFRAAASLADEDLVELFSGILPVAVAMQLGSEWRIAAPPVKLEMLAGDLDALGPAERLPVRAPDFRLPNHAGREIALEDYRGRPVLVNFFLGVGCVYCAEQLNMFLPHLKRFREAGIEMVAISTDSQEVLQKALGAEEPLAPEIAQQFPFPILSDADGKTFNAYGVVDDYGIGGMHATFLIDGEGRILWQDISRLPFEQPDALVGEAKRLLGLSASAPGD